MADYRKSAAPMNPWASTRKSTTSFTIIAPTAPWSPTPRGRLPRDPAHCVISTQTFYVSST